MAWGLFQNSAVDRMKQMNEDLCDLWEECNCLVFIRWSLFFSWSECFKYLLYLCLCCLSLFIINHNQQVGQHVSGVDESCGSSDHIAEWRTIDLWAVFIKEFCLPATEHFIGICGFTIMLACVCAQAVGRELSEPHPHTHTHTTRVALDGSSLRAKRSSGLPSSSFSQSLICAFCFWTSLMKVQWTQVLLDVHMMGLKPHLPSLLPACSPPPASQLTVTAQCPYKGWGPDDR